MSEDGVLDVCREVILFLDSLTPVARIIVPDIIIITVWMPTRPSKLFIPKDGPQ